MICEALTGSAFPFASCENTANGARIVTHCLYPSFDPVAIYILQNGDDGFIVHDGGGAVDVAWAHGGHPDAVKHLLRDQASRFGLDVNEGKLIGKCLADWLPNMVLAVSNAASFAANAVLALEVVDPAVEDDNLKERVYLELVSSFTEPKVPRRIKRRGRSGKAFTFDFAVTDGARMSLIDVVTPSQNSIVHKYTAFAAVGARSLGGAFAVHDRPLADEDVSLLSEVADVLPFASLSAGVERQLRGQ